MEREERERLEDEFTTLEEEMGHATRHVTDLEERAKALVESRPPGEDVEARPFEEWTRERVEVDKEVERLIGERGVLTERHEQQKRALKKSESWRDELLEAQEEYNVWQTIHQLIGTRGGEAFKQFAQSLNLQELVDRANSRLTRLAPRYELAVALGEQGEPLLDFAVKDHHQANTTRPLTTLSGGETFLVSLALALGLADFRRVDMPVETLLLDEGFGTLDQDTLDVAMNTLRQLQRESVQQIGLISHVEALRERIDTRIVVEKLGNGRSTIFADNGGERHLLSR